MYQGVLKIISFTPIMGNSGMQHWLRSWRFLSLIPYLCTVAIGAVTFLDGTMCSSPSMAERGAFVESPESDDDEWSEVIDLDMATAIQMAIETNKTLANSIDSLKKAQMQRQLSESDFRIKVSPNGDAGYIGGGRAGMGLTLGGGFDFKKKFSSGTSITVNPYLTRDAHNYHAGVKALFSQPLLKGFGEEYTLAPIYASRYSHRSAQRSAYLAGVEVINRTIQALYEVLRQEELSKLERKAYNRIKKFCEVIGAKRRIGLADSLDVYRAETELAHTEESLNSSIDRLQSAKDSLKDLLGLPLASDISLKIDLDYHPIDIDLNEAIAIALQQRIELFQAEDQYRENIRLARLAKKNIMPDLNVVVDYSTTGYDEAFTRSFSSKRESRWGVGLTSSTDIDRLSQKVAYEQSLLAVSSAERSLQQTKNNIALDVKKIWRAAEFSESKIERQREQVHRSLGEMQLARLKYDRGFANNFDVIQAEKNLRNAETALLGALIDYNLSQYKVRTALGLLADKPEICQ